MPATTWLRRQCSFNIWAEIIMRLCKTVMVFHATFAVPATLLAADTWRRKQSSLLRFNPMTGWLRLTSWHSLPLPQHQSIHLLSPASDTGRVRLPGFAIRLLNPIPELILD
jgi:hypothetical protein